MTEIASLEVRIGADTSGLDRGLRDTDSRLATFGSRMQSAGRQISGLGVSIGLLAAPLIAGLGESVRQAVEFESAFAGVRKTVDASEAEFAALEQAILEMATSPDELTSSLANADTALARIMELGGQLGVDGVDNLTKFTETVALLGMTTNLSVESAATELARFANVTGMPIANIDRLGSVIVDLGNNMATTEAEIVEMAQRLAGAGTVVGLTEPEVLALSAALSSVGINAEAGGSAFSRVMLKIQEAVDGGGAELARFADVAGVSASDFTTAWETDPANALNAFLLGLRDANAEGANMSAILGDLELDEIRTRDALLRLITGQDQLTEALGIANDAWDDNTALVEEASRRADTTESSLNRLRNNVDELARSTGEALTPALRDLSADLIPVIQNIADWTAQNPELTTTIAAITLGIGALSIALIGIGAVISAVGTIITGLGVIVGLLATPLGLVVVAVGAVVAVFATDFLGIRTYIEQVGQGLQRFLEDIGLIENAARNATRELNAMIGAAAGGHAGTVAAPEPFQPSSGNFSGGSTPGGFARSGGAGKIQAPSKSTFKGGARVPTFAEGGTMPWDGLAYLHENEEVLNPREARAYRFGRGGSGGIQIDTVNVVMPAGATREQGREFGAAFVEEIRRMG